MTITADQKFLLNNKMGSIARKVQLGTLIENAESVTAGEIALASAKLLVGNASGVGVAVSMSGDATMDNTGAVTLADDSVDSAQIVAGAIDNEHLAADIITGDEIQDDAVSVEHLDDGILPGYVAKLAGTHTTAGGDTAETISAAGVTTSHIVFVMVKTAGASPVYVTAAAAGTDDISVKFSADPSRDHVLQWIAFLAAA